MFVLVCKFMRWFVSSEELFLFGEHDDVFSNIYHNDSKSRRYVREDFFYTSSYGNDCKT